MGQVPATPSLFAHLSFIFPSPGRGAPCLWVPHHPCLSVLLGLGTPPRPRLLRLG